MGNSLLTIYGLYREGHIVLRVVDLLDELVPNLPLSVTYEEKPLTTRARKDGYWIDATFPAGEVSLEVVVPANQFISSPLQEPIRVRVPIAVSLTSFSFEVGNSIFSSSDETPVSFSVAPHVSVAFTASLALPDAAPLATALLLLQRADGRRAVLPLRQQGVGFCEALQRRASWTARSCRRAAMSPRCSTIRRASSR